MLKELGRNKKQKKIKCKKCNVTFNIKQDEIINTGGRKSVYCMICGEENILRK